MLRYLFYSSKCKACFRLMTVMENQGLINLFQLQSVDDWNTDEYIRWGVEHVPTILIVSNINGQRQKGIYQRKDAFEWVENTIANRRQSMIAYAEQTRKQAELIQMKKRMQEGCYEYCQNEAEGISDAYAYLADPVNSEIGSAQPKTFIPITRPDKNGNYAEDPRYAIMPIPENKEEKKLRQERTKLREQRIQINEKEYKALERKARDENNKLIKSLENSRKDQDCQIKETAEQEQLNRIMNAGENMF